jgi:cyclophilin family peptidyl-prolyl cis-trans isomerase
MTRQSIEPLEARIAPAVAILNPLFDIQAGAGATGAVIDLGKLVDPFATNRTVVEFITNLTLPGQTEPGKIVVELFDDKAPLSVQNFLRYVASGTYDSAFFHRIFDFGASSEAGTDIIQGGGFRVSSMFSHVSTFTTVHNEFDATDPELQNIRGTLAMAKTAISPHTASSEWFFNLTDNSSILGAANNGGFTVFGRITAGLDVADAIGQAKKINLGGAFTDLPVQNHSSGLPSSSQLIQITDARIVETPGNADGHTFSVVSDSSIVRTRLNPVTNELTLTYVRGQAGTANITVTVSKNGESSTDEFAVALTPNLISTFDRDTLPDVFVPGDKGVVKVKLANSAGGTAKGFVNVRLFLSSTAEGNDKALTIDGDDIEITPASTRAFRLNLQSGQTVALSVPYLVPDTLNPGTEYFLLVKPEASDVATQDLFTDDNVGVSFTDHTFTRAFGSVGARSNVPLTVADLNGDVITLNLRGAGIGTVSKDAAGDLDISIAGSTAGTAFTVKTARGVVADIDDLFIQNTVGIVKLGNVHLHGHFTASGGARSIAFGELGSDAGGTDKSLSIGIFPVARQLLSLSFGKVNDYSLFSGTPVARLTAKSWLDDEAGTAPNRINVAGISSLTINGDLEADLLVASSATTRLVNVTGALRGSEIKSGGDFVTMKFGSIENSSILVGLSEQPDTLSDFSIGKKVSSLRVAGSVTASAIAATTFNSIIIGSADGAGASDGGIFADAIKRYIRKGSSRVILANLNDATPGDDQPLVADTEFAPNYKVTVY